MSNVGAPFLGADRSGRPATVFEDTVLVAGLLLMSGAILPLFLGAPDAAWDPQGYPSVQAILLIFYAGVCLLMVRRWRAALMVASRDPLLWVLMAWVFLSVIWSDVPSLTGRRALGLLLTTAVGLYIATRFDLEDQVRLFAWTLALAALLSVLAVLFWPDYGIDREFWRGPAWRGVYTQKNNLARLMALLTVSSLVLVFGRRATSRWWIGIAALSAAFPLLARSLTALIATLELYGLLAVLFVWHRRAGGRIEASQLKRLAAVVVLTAGVWTGVWYLQRLAPAPVSGDPPPSAVAERAASDQVALIDRRATALGRIELWRLVGDKILERPWLGYGYGAFWVGNQGAAADVWSRLQWKPPSAHNGFLDVALGIGAIGLLLMCAHLFKTGAQVIESFRRRGLEPCGLWPISFLAFFLLYSLPETSMLVQNSLLWTAYVAVAFSPNRVETRKSKSETTSKSEIRKRT